MGAKQPPNYNSFMRARTSDTASQQSFQQQPSGSGANPASGGQRGHSNAALQNHSYPPTFVVDHLATFSALSRQGRVLSPQDGVSQFRLMAQKTGVWILRLYIAFSLHSCNRLVVGEKELVVLEGDSGGEIMETFPITQVSRPAACLDPNETHDNVLLFTVLPDPRGSGMDTISSSTAASTPEIHFFQCSDASAQDVVDVIIAAKTGRLKKPSSSSSQPMRYLNPDAAPTDRAREMENAAQRTADAVNVYRQRAPQGQGRRTANQSDVSNSDRAVHWVDLLNRCFDDIERFMGRLQAVADAYRELEERRKRGRDNRKDRMLTLKMNIRKNPSEAEFTDIFQKFRLSFNLLAVLRPHIHDPNAPELVHFLFTPLSLVLEASQDPLVDQNRKNGTEEIRTGVAARVREPPMSVGAVELLANCLTSKEIELWKILAETWTVPARPGYVSSYIPRFYDGWNPPPSWLDGLYDDGSSTRVREPMVSPVNNHMANSMPMNMPMTMPVDMGQYNRRGPPWADPRLIGAAQFPPWQDPRLIGATPFSAPFPPWQDPHLIGGPGFPPQLREVPSLQPNWPSNLVPPKPHKSKAPPPVVPPVVASTPIKQNQIASGENRKADGKAKYYQILKNRVSTKQDEITVKKGEIVQVLENKNSYWKITNNQGQTGYVPKTCLQPYFGDLQFI